MTLVVLKKCESRIIALSCVNFVVRICLFLSSIITYMVIFLPELGTQPVCGLGTLDRFPKCSGLLGGRRD